MQQDREQPFFSIVMPCYGVEAYLAHALECVQAQTFSDWELIVVDDGTPDASMSIVADYVAGDARIRVVSHRENRGLPAARNTGIDKARGRYLWMPDPDDTYDLNLLQKAFATLSQQDSSSSIDVIMFGHVEEYYDAQGEFLYNHALPMEPGSFLQPGAWHPLMIKFEQNTQYGYAWNKMYRLERVRQLGLRFEQVQLIEDIAFNVAFFQDAIAICVLEGTPYHYAKRQGSSLTNANAYPSSEYYALHHRRIVLLRDQLMGWNVLDKQARAILGGLYGRYVLSTLERQCNPAEGLSRTERRAWCKNLFSDSVYEELIPSAQAKDSKALGVCLALLRLRSASLCLTMGHILFFVHKHAYSVFTRARSGR